MQHQQRLPLVEPLLLEALQQLLASVPLQLNERLVQQRIRRRVTELAIVTTPRRMVLRDRLDDRVR